MDRAAFPPLTFTALFLRWACYADEDTLTCPELQEGFDGSCYEFVGLRRSFLSAQGWCERGGGHLVFILNDETQQFLQKHLEPEKDWWLGLAPAAPNLTLEAGLSSFFKMMSFEKNPYSWKEENITGIVGSLSLSRMDGTVIPVENLPEEIEILLPRLDTGPENITTVDLANFSTVILDIPSPDVTLVLKVEPSENISFVLLLGYNDYPNDENFVAKTQIPLENSKEEEKYTWVLSPQNRTGDVGVHYLVIKPIVEPGIKSVNATVAVTTIAAQCKYWNETQSGWSEDGCRVGPLTTSLVTQCLCNHLTFFGSSFFVMPNLVDVSRTAELFATFTNNPVVVCFVGAIFFVYLLVIVWARRKDIQDSTKVKITVLEDNDPLAEYCYMLSVSTGHRHGANTSSQVTITLLGTEGESDPHHLTDPEKPVFERGGVDMFLMTTHFSLGDLQSIRLWHDNSGGRPAWYVNKVIVQDLETGQKWHFLCNSWLAVDVGECSLDKVFPVATEIDLKKFSNLFFMKTAKDFSDGHIWFSVVSRPPCSTFTRVQRVSCCFSLLLCTMLTSIMFWGIPTDPSDSIIMFPINLFIVSIFRNTRPREKSSKGETSKQCKTGRVSPSQTSSPQKDMCGSPEKTSDEVQKKNNNSRYLYRQLRHVEKELGLLGPSRFPDSDSYNQAMQQVQGMKGLLDFHLPSSSLNSELLDHSPSPEESVSSGNSGKKCCLAGLPWWFVFIGWTLVIATSSVSGYFTMMYGLTYGKERSISWLISMVVSFFESLFITQPLKVSRCWFLLWMRTYCIRAARRDSTCSFYQPPPPTDIERIRNNMIKERKVFALMGEIIGGRNTLLPYGQRDPNAYFLSHHIRQSFSKGISDSMSIHDVFHWANTTLLSSLFGQRPGQCVVDLIKTAYNNLLNTDMVVTYRTNCPTLSGVVWFSTEEEGMWWIWDLTCQIPAGRHILYSFELEVVGICGRVFLLWTEYFMFQQGKLIKQQRWAYLRSKWNLLELGIIILSWSALSVFIKRTLLGNRDIYASFHQTAQADAVLGYLIAFLVLLATVKLWHLLRLNPKLHMITSTLQRAWSDISGFLVVMTIMFLAYSIASNLLYGWKLYSYRTLLDAAQTMVSLQLGIFNYEEVLNYNPVLGAFLIGSCIVFMTFVVLNLFISVILVAFSEEQNHHKEEIVDLMLMKLCSLFGLKFKQQGDEPPAKQPLVSSRSATLRGSPEDIHDG
uniref:Polycystic kidney disease 1 like 2a n=1 Tax=Cynoglossus semilaevis TaxID=244447 RepID=A0A3P8WV34_CYNSE